MVIVYYGLAALVGTVAVLGFYVWGYRAGRRAGMEATEHGSLVRHGED